LKKENYTYPITEIFTGKTGKNSRYVDDKYTHEWVIESRVDRALGRLERFVREDDIFIDERINRVLDRHVRLVGEDADDEDIKVTKNTPTDIGIKWYIPENVTIADNTTIWRDGSRTITDKILIIDNATLILYNFTLIMNATDYGKAGILLLNGSKLVLNYSTITYDPAGYEYFIRAEANTTLSVLNGSLIEHAGWSPTNPGIEIGLNYTIIGREAVVTIENSTISDCYNGLTLLRNVNATIMDTTFQNIQKYGINVSGKSEVTIINTSFTGGETAIYVNDSNAVIRQSTFSGTTNYDIIAEAGATITIGNSTFSVGGIKISNSTATIENDTFMSTTYGIYIENSTVSIGSSTLINEHVKSISSIVTIKNSNISISLVDYTTSYYAVYIDGASTLAIKSTTIKMVLEDASTGTPEDIAAVCSNGNITLEDVGLSASFRGASDAVPVLLQGPVATIMDSRLYGEVYNSSVMYLVEIYDVSDTEIDDTSFEIYAYDRRYKESSNYYIEALDVIYAVNVTVNNSYFFANITGNSTLPYNNTDFCDDSYNYLAIQIYGYKVSNFIIKNTTIDAWVYWLGQTNP